MLPITAIIVSYDPTNKVVESCLFKELLCELQNETAITRVYLVNNDSHDKITKYKSFIFSNNLSKVTIKSTGINKGLSGGFNYGFNAITDQQGLACFIALDCSGISGIDWDQVKHAFETNNKLACLHPWSMFEDNNFYNSMAGTSYEQYVKLRDSSLSLRQAIALEDKQHNKALRIHQHARMELTPTIRMPLTCAIFSVRRLKEVNGFDERFVAGGENVDLGVRLTLSDGELYRVNNMVIKHRRLSLRLLGQGGGNQVGSIHHTVQDGKNLLKDVHGNWQKIYFVKRYGNLALFISIVYRFRKIIRRGLRKWPFQNW